jgi:hypothetical protein
MKISTITYYLNKWNASNATIKELLNLLEGEYVHIAAQKGMRPRLEKNDYNRLLLEALYLKKFISSYADKESFYQVNTRNID